MKRLKRLFLFIFLLAVIFLIAGCETLTLTAKGTTNTTENTTTKDTFTTTTKDSSIKTSLNIFQINDTHGELLNNGYFASMSQVAGLLDSLENTNGEYIKICVGDLFQGSYVSSKTKGEPFIECLNAMDFDCMVLGNHEFDWGLETIEAYFDGDSENGEADFPMLCCNLIENSTGEIPSWIDPYMIMDYEGVKVGIIGAIGEDLTTDILTEMVEDYTFLPSIACIESCAETLRAEGVDIIIVAIHEHASGTLISLADLGEDTAIDAVLCAHDHSYVEDYYTRSFDKYRIPVIESDDKNETVGTMTINLNANNDPINATMKHYSPAYYSYSNQDIDNIVAKYQSIINDGKEVIGTTEYLSKTELGLIACNSMESYFLADVGIMNTGGVRTTIYEGDLTIEDIFEVFPFENYVYIVSVPGSILKTFYSYYSGYLYFSSDFDVSSISDNITYKVAIIDYVFTSTYYYWMFESLPSYNTGVLMRDTVIDHFS